MNMNRTVWKIFGSVCAAIWMLTAGFIAWIYIIFAIYILGYPDPPKPEYFSGPLGFLMLKVGPMAGVIGYILFGLGPVVCFTLLMKKLRMPLEPAYLIGLSICASAPVIIPLLCYLHASLG
jgi:hypothetical protein